MDRFGLFVDAGYLLAAGGQLCLGEKQRSKFVCDYAAIHEELLRFCRAHAQLPHFRTYWYDGGYGSPHPQPTTDQLKIAALSSVKLRLGRIIRGQQKGVDSMITRDLMTLARERTMPIAYLLSGDEDLREAVVAAQDLGVQVILLGISPVPGLTNQSFTLVNECDACEILNEEQLSPFFTRHSTVQEEEVDSILDSPVDIAPAKSELEIARELGRNYCEGWLDRHGAETGLLLHAQSPMVPKDIDGPLLRKAESVLGSLRGREHLRKEVRQGFSSRLGELLVPLENGDASADNATSDSNADSNLHRRRRTKARSEGL